MVFRRVLLLTSIFHLSVAFDFVRESFSLVDQDSDPCDDFFRHACPKGDYGYLVDSVYDKFSSDYFQNREPRVWDNLKSQKALHNLKGKLAELPLSTVDYIVELFQTQCENEQDTESILEKLEEIIKQTKHPKCHQTDCLTILSSDVNCNRSASTLSEKLKILLPKHSEEPVFYLNLLDTTFSELFSNINAISLIIDGNMRDGVVRLNGFVTDMIDILKEMIWETPWLKNQDLEVFVHELAEDIKFEENFAQSLEYSLNSLMKLELTYLECMADINIESGEWLCLIYAHRLANIGKVDQKFWDIYNAFNDHPSILFGYPLFHIAQNSSLAGSLGFSGMVAGHEISHTLIEDPKNRELFPLYSELAIQCVQDQFRASCAEYKEAVCDVEDRQIDDNGADILGGQLAYKLLEKYMGDRMKEEYIKLNKLSITHQQLFFYSAAFSFCQGSNAGHLDDIHAAGNVRVNALAQLPGFQDAFKCSNDSRIMKTAKKQCFIFGKDAPAQRHK